MSKIIGPKRWRSDKIEHRFSSSAPLSYNAAEHSCECIISAGASVARVYGREILEISRAAIDLSRIPCPLLDSHNQQSIDNVLGVIESAWVTDKKLYGKIRFAQTPRGRLAEGMVARGEITGISAGYRVDEWAVVDANGEPVDEDNAGWSDKLTFTAKRWQLYEGSLVGVPADFLSAVRRFGSDSDHVEDVRTRMEARERMAARQRMHARASDLEYDEANPQDPVKMIIDRAKARQKLHDTVQKALAASDDFGD
jgi:phage head maturation protease